MPPLSVGKGFKTSKIQGAFDSKKEEHETQKKKLAALIRPTFNLLGFACLLPALLLLEGLLDLLSGAAALGGRSLFREALTLGTHVRATGLPRHCCVDGWSLTKVVEKNFGCR